MRNRYYNPDLKRFMNRDVVTGGIEDSQTLNRYSYVNGNPISYNDPFGLARESIADSSWLSNVQTGLDIAGMVPGLGVFPDVLNASIYLASGEYEEALWSGIGAIPVLGDATSGIRNVNKISKLNNSVEGQSLKRLDKRDTPYKYWAKEVNYEGNKVYQRDDLFDPNYRTSWLENKVSVEGTNIERMKTGRAPHGKDGFPVNLHHMTQRQKGAISEVGHKFHKKNHGVIHVNSNKIPSGINRGEFEKWKKNYWVKRSEDYTN